MKKNIYIKIDDISEIDTSKISVYDLNKRFIDKKGSIYGLKYDMYSKKIEVIKIIRADSKEAAQHQLSILKSKQNLDAAQAGKDAAKSPEAKEAEPAQDRDSDDYNFEETISNFNSDKFIKETIDLLIRHKSRLKGIESNIKNSNIVSKNNKHDNSELDDILRGIDMEGGQNIDKIENYQKELLNYPRSITYYQSKIDKTYSYILEALKSDSKRLMRFIYNYEMHYTIKKAYTHLLAAIKKLNEFMLSRDIDLLKSKSAGERLAFNDAQVSLDNTISEIEGVIDDLKLLDAFNKNPNNF